MGQQSSVRALERGLDIIQLLNRHNGLTVTQVGQLTDLPRPTAFRLLRTLESLGFLFRDKQDKKYRLTLQVRTLSHGYDQEEWIPKVARPIMVDLCKKMLWPLALGTINGAHILVRDTTDEISPFAIRRHRGGLQIPLLSTASGSAYLAFSDTNKREELIEFAMAGQRSEAQALNEKLLGLHSNLFMEPNPIPSKWALSEMGLMLADCRLPLVPLTDEGQYAVRQACEQAGISL